MTIVAICLPDHAYTRLTELANQHNVTTNKLLEQWSTIAIAESDAERRFHAMATQGSRGIGLSLLDKLDALGSSRIG